MELGLERQGYGIHNTGGKMSRVDLGFMARAQVWPLEVICMGGNKYGSRQYIRMDKTVQRKCTKKNQKTESSVNLKIQNLTS